jgi:ABC-type nitrate/sulfonate/bicarbonate transport system substrate-binding protein
VKELVGSPARADCLRNGDCDAVPLGQPDDLLAVKDGYRRLGDTTEAVSSFTFDVIAVRRDFAETHRPAIIGLVSALADACRFIHDPARRDELTRAIVELTGASDDIARATLALYLEPDRGVVPRQAEIDLGGVVQVIAFMGQGGRIKPPLPAPEQFVDLQYLKAAGAK